MTDYDYADAMHEDEPYECPNCGGVGGGPDAALTCPVCRGRGYLQCDFAAWMRRTNEERRER